MPLKRERAIIALLASTLVPLVYAGRQHFSVGSVGCHTSRTDHDLNRIGSELLTYRQLTGSLPTTEQGLTALVTRPTSPPFPKRWRALAKAVPRDKWNHDYRYRRLPEGDDRRFEIWSIGKDGVNGTRDDESSLPR
jgi:general secretion pathway protein G